MAASVQAQLDELPSFAVGEKLRILVSSATLRTLVSDAYWTDQMSEICDGKVEGVFVRYTGPRLAFAQFMLPSAACGGRAVPVGMSLPLEFLTPKVGRKLDSSVGGEVGPLVAPPRPPLFAASRSSSMVAKTPVGGSSLAVPHLCVVCGRWGAPGEVRRNGYKCSGCIGTKSNPLLRRESQKFIES